MAARTYKPKQQLLCVVSPPEALPENRLCYVAEERQ